MITKLMQIIINIHDKTHDNTIKKSVKLKNLHTNCQNKRFNIPGQSMFDTTLVLMYNSTNHIPKTSIQLN